VREQALHPPGRARAGGREEEEGAGLVVQACALLSPALRPQTQEGV
jgi:hypothetical protein